MDADQLWPFIRDIPDFPQPGVVFRDITPLLGDPTAFRAATELMAAPFDGPVTKVVGIEARGFILAAPIALALGAGFVPVRKPGKLPWDTHAHSYELEYGSDTLEVHRDALTPDDRVLIVDDVLATGGTATATCRLVSEFFEATVVGVTLPAGAHRPGRPGAPDPAGPPPRVGAGRLVTHFGPASSGGKLDERRPPMEHQPPTIVVVGAGLAGLTAAASAAAAAAAPASPSSRLAPTRVAAPAPPRSTASCSTRARTRSTRRARLGDAHRLRDRAAGQRARHVDGEGAARRRHARPLARERGFAGDHVAAQRPRQAAGRADPGSPRHIWPTPPNPVRACSSGSTVAPATPTVRALLHLLVRTATYCDDLDRLDASGRLAPARAGGHARRRVPRRRVPAAGRRAAGSRRHARCARRSRTRRSTPST